MPITLNATNYNFQTVLKNPKQLRGIAFDMESAINPLLDYYALTTKVFETKHIQPGTVYSFPRNPDDESFTVFKDTVGRPPMPTKITPVSQSTIHPPELLLYGTFVLDLTSGILPEMTAKHFAADENMLLFDLLRATTNLSTGPMTDDIYTNITEKLNTDAGILLVPLSHAEILNKLTNNPNHKQTWEEQAFCTLNIKKTIWTVYLDYTETLTNEIFAITGKCGFRGVRHPVTISFSQDPGKPPNFLAEYILSLSLQDARKVARMLIV